MVRIQQTVVILGVLFCFGMLSSHSFAQVPAAQTPGAGTVDQATNVLNEFLAIPNKGIPRSLLSRAQGLVIIPGTVKISFIGGVRRGKGVVVTRDANGVWKPPMFITMTGGSVGFQGGIQSTDVVLVFMTQKSVNGLLTGKFTIGADAAVAAGPVGRQAAAATDGRLQAEILSYSRSRGLFLGVSINGAALQIDAPANLAYYNGTGMTADGTPIGPNVQLPPSASRLLAQLATYTPAAAVVPGAAAAGAPTANHGVLPTGPAGAMGAPAASTALTPGANQPVGATAGSAHPLPLGAPPSVAASTTPAMTRQQIAGAAAQLGRLLDDTWRQYLAIPTEVFSGNANPSVAKLDTIIARFDRVVHNPQYQQLTNRPEFQTLYQLLQTYRRELGGR